MHTQRVSDPQYELAVWIARNQPHVFEALVREANKRGQLHGITDWLSSVGSSLGDAAKSVGSFLTSQQGIATLGTIGGLYLQTQAQKDALKLQIRQAQVGQAPIPIQSVGANPYSSVPVYTDPTTGQSYSLTPQLTSQLQSGNGWRDSLPWLIGGGFLILVLAMSFRGQS